MTKKKSDMTERELQLAIKNAASLGESLRIAYKARGFTQESLAAELGIPRSTLAEWLTSREPPAKKFLRMASVLKIDPYLLAGVPRK